MKYILSIIIMLWIFTGCSNNQKANNITPQKVQKPISDDTSINRYSETEKAKNIADKISRTKGIKKVVVVVAGKRALIGIDANKNIISDQSYLKLLATQMVREVDSNISVIEVTTDQNMYNRISKLNDDILNDKPLSGIAQEFLQIIKGKKQ